MLHSMPLSPTDTRLFEEACANSDNAAARDLLNVFGTTTVAEILKQVNAVPVTIRADLMDQVRQAIEQQRRLRAKR